MPFQVALILSNALVKALDASVASKASSLYLASTDATKPPYAAAPANAIPTAPRKPAKLPAVTPIALPNAITADVRPAIIGIKALNDATNVPRTMLPSTVPTADIIFASRINSCWKLSFMLSTSVTKFLKFCLAFLNLRTTFFSIFFREKIRDMASACSNPRLKRLMSASTSTSTSSCNAAA